MLCHPHHTTLHRAVESKMNGVHPKQTHQESPTNSNQHHQRLFPQSALKLQQAKIKTEAQILNELTRPRLQKKVSFRSCDGVKGIIRPISKVKASLKKKARRQNQSGTNHEENEEINSTEKICDMLPYSGPLVKSPNLTSLEHHSLRLFECHTQYCSEICTIVGKHLLTLLNGYK